MSSEHGPSTNERQFILEALEEYQLRVDGRQLNDSRNLSLSFRRRDDDAQCSAEVQWGTTRVVAVVQGDIISPYVDRPTEGLLQFHVEFSPMASCGDRVDTETSVELARVLERSIRTSKALDTEALAIVAGSQVWQIRVRVHVLDHGGNILDAVSFAAVAALKFFRRPDVSIRDSGNGESGIIRHESIERPSVPLALHHVPLSISYAFIPHDKNDKLVVLVDPNEREEAIADGGISYTLNSFDELCAVHQIGGSPLGLEDVLYYGQLAQVKAKEVLGVLMTELVAAEAKETQARRQAARGKQFLDTSSSILNENIILEQPLVLEQDKTLERLTAFDQLHAPIPLRQDVEPEQVEAQVRANANLRSTLEASVGLSMSREDREAFQQAQERSVFGETVKAQVKEEPESGVSSEEEEEEYKAEKRHEMVTGTSPIVEPKTQDDSSDSSDDSSSDEDLTAALR